MSYEYINRAYGIQPIIGEPVRLKNYPPGKVAPEDLGQAHYVMVRFEGWDHDAPIHPDDLKSTREDGLAKADVSNHGN